jgi:spore germination protein YaaH
MDEAYRTAVSNRDLFRTANPFWYATQRDGSVKPKPGAGDPTVTARLKASGIRVVPTVTDPGISATSAARVFNNTSWRRQHVGALVGLVRSNGYDGIDLDYETMGVTPASVSQRAAARRGYVTLVAELCAALHRLGKSCSVTVMPKLADGSGVYDYAGLGAAADRLKVMAYDEHWSRSSPGPIASLPWVTRVLKYTLTRVPARKLELGVPTYGRDWGPRSSTALSGTDGPGLAKKWRTRLRWDSTAAESFFRYTDKAGKRHTVYVASARSVRARVALARKHGLAGVALWTVSGAPKGSWTAIRTALKKPSSPNAAALGTAIPASANKPVAPTVVARAKARLGPYPGSPIRYGSRGTAVTAVQRALRIAADGVFGPKTLAAVKAFQASRGLATDGIVGPRTWAALG